VSSPPLLNYLPKINGSYFPSSPRICNIVVVYNLAHMRGGGLYDIAIGVVLKALCMIALRGCLM
jgi:hypothetical protein